MSAEQTLTLLEDKSNLEEIVNDFSESAESHFVSN